MNRRSFNKLGLTIRGTSALPLAALAFQTGTTHRERPLPSYPPAPGSWSTGGVEVANPMSIYSEYKATRSLWNPDPGKFDGFTVEISTDKGLKGYGAGGAGGGAVIEQHLVKLLIGQNPFNIERIWDILYRSTMPYGQAGIAINAISGVDLAH